MERPRKLNLPERFTGHELHAIASRFKDQLTRSMRGEQTDLGMFNSQLPSNLCHQEPPDGQALVVEVGGTNVYAAQYTFCKGKPSLKTHQSIPLESRTFDSAEDFYNSIITPLGKVITSYHPDRLGIVYSFPGQSIPARDTIGVDMISDQSLSKGFIIPGIDEVPVGEALKKAMHSRYMLPLSTPSVVMNDTVAVLFADQAQIGGVVGTGFNLAVAMSNGVFNTEAGQFRDIPLSEELQIFDGRSNNPGQRLAEKYISGLYLGGLFTWMQGEETMQKLMKRYGATDPTQVMSELLVDRDFKLPDFVVNAFSTAKMLRDRSAQLVGAIISGTILAFPKEFTQPIVHIPIEGSLFWKMPGYREEVERVISVYSGKQIQFPEIKDAGRVGAARAALLI